MRYKIEFTNQARTDYGALSAYDRKAVFDEIEKNLRYEPTRVTRNRKPLVCTQSLEDSGISWELRVGRFRVFYDVEPGNVVVIRIVLKGNRTTEGSLR